MVTYLELNILVCEGKWALGSITTNKASRDDRISAALLKILKDDDVKLLYSMSANYEKSTVVTRLENVSFLSFQSQRRAITKNVQNTE